MKELIINLAKPPEERWDGLIQHKKGFNKLIEFFSGEILETVPVHYLNMLELYAANFLTKEHLAELTAISHHMHMPLKNVLIGNLYYDALKIALGCSAFAINTSSGPVHGRNLDWYSNQNDLSNHTLVKRYINGENEYITIGWPGFTGCLSGMAIGKFSISLNAVLSNDPFLIAPPVVYLIREVLEKASCFDEAIQKLKDTQIASDCLLLVTGVKTNEMAVIERTPTASKVRYSKNGKITVTNDYQLIEKQENLNNNELSFTSCSRYNSVNQLLEKQAPSSAQEVFSILTNENVKMGITMQHLFFSGNKQSYQLLKPSQ